MIKNIIFDVGNVLVTYDPDNYLKSLGFDKETRDAVNNAMFKNDLWNESDRGVIPAEELAAGFVANNPAFEAEIRKAYNLAEGTIQSRDYAVDWVNGLKERGYRLYILSNYAEGILEKTKCKMEFLPLMDGAVFSFQCKLIKPEAEIYKHLCDTYGLVPSESVFLDDRLDNVEAAEKFGFHAIQFSDYEQGSGALEELLASANEE